MPNGRDSLAPVKGLLASGLQAAQNDGLDTGAGVALHINASGKNGEKMYVKAYLQWGASPVDTKYGYTGDRVVLKYAYVWYDLFAYDANTGTELARKIGVYGDSGWRLKNSGNGYVIEK
jgi:hypothetical protein